MTTSTRFRSWAPALVLAAACGLAGCSSSGENEASDSGSLSTMEQEPAGADALAEGDRSRAGAQVADRSAATPSDTQAPTGPAIIQTGTMTVESDDVARARFDLGKVVDAHGGSIAEEKTTATSEGDVRLSRLVVRVPSDDFDATLSELAELGEVTESTRKAEDVTDQVIDTRARIRAQEQSLARVEVLFGQATNIRDIVAIESQLSRRQADLDSLKGQLAYLEDQTTYSTIAVYLELAPTATAAPAPDDVAFVGGLRDGWHALAAVGSGLATLAGALLPFAVVTLVLGVPALLLGRRWLSRHPWRRAAAEG